MLNLDGDMRQVGEPGQSLPVMRRLMGIRRRDPCATLAVP
jgi:hypothetical protein